MPDSHFFYPDPPDLLRVPGAQSASASFTSTSSYGSSRFDQLSKRSQFTDLTLVTPLDSVDSIFGDDPDLQPLPKFSDSSWDGLSDEQWRQCSLLAQAHYAVKEAREAIFRDFDEPFLLGDPWLESECAKPDDEFDAVAAVRRRLLREEPTLKTRRALEIIEQRSRSSTSAAEASREVETFLESKAVVTEAEHEIEDYGDDFDLGTQEVFEIPDTPDELEVEVMLTGDISLWSVEENSTVHASRSVESTTLPTAISLLDHDIVLSPFQYTLNLAMPPKPVILPADAEWDCPSFASDLTSVESISQMLVSPMQLDHPTFTSSPVIMNHPSGDMNPPHSPIVSISSFLFRSRRTLPTSLLDESLDIATLMHLEVAVALQTDNAARDTPRQTRNQSALGRGLGFAQEAIPISCDTSPPSPSYSPIFPSSLSEGNILVLPNQQNAASPESKIEPSSVFPETSNERFLNTVTADSDHPAATASFTNGYIDSFLHEGGQGGTRKGLGLGLPSGIAWKARPPPTMSTAEECDDLAALAMALPSTGNLFSGFRRRLSAILEVVETPSQELPVGQLSEAPPQIAPEAKKPSRWQWFGRKMRWFVQSPKVATSPGMIEHLDAPRGLGLFRRGRSSPASPGKVGFRGVTRTLKMLF